MKIKLTSIFYIILILLFRFNNSDDEEFEDYDKASACEKTENVESYDDCKQRGTEYVYEVCCFLEGALHGEEEKECVDIIRDDVRNKVDLNITRDKIKNGTYWSTYNESYDYIKDFRCFSNYIFSNNFLIFFVLIIII